MRVLILHGPNMNLFGIRSSKKGENITLDKINRYIRQYIKNKNLDIKIIQTHNEVKAGSYLHANKNNFNGVILTPGSWQNSAHILKETLEIIDLKYIVIKLEKDEIVCPNFVNQSIQCKQCKLCCGNQIKSNINIVIPSH